MNADPEAVAKRAASLIAAEAAAAVTSRGSFTMAVSGGNTPWQMLRTSSAEAVPWANLHVRHASITRTTDRRISLCSNPRLLMLAVEAREPGQFSVDACTLNR